MAPYKLEDNIREKLETREIKPSADAWKKLEAKLDSQEPKRRTYAWYYIAASFVGLLILSSIYFNGTNTELNNGIVKEKDVKNNLELIPNNSNREDVVAVENDSEEPLELKEKENEKLKALKPIPQKKSKIDQKIDRTEMLAEAENKEEKQLLEDSSKKIEEDNLFNFKVDEVVASVKKLEGSSTELTVIEVEQLLKDARRDIRTQQILNSPKVDAAALLQDVEWELEKSFRDKVFDALGEGFRKIRTAVLERND